MVVQRLVRSVSIAAGALLILAAPSRAEDAPPRAIPIAVAEFDYRDTSGEVRNQEAEHAARLRRFAELLREGLDRSGKYRAVPFTCGGEPCSAGRSDPAELTAEARRAGAALVLYGGIQKMSTLIQNAKVEMVDVETNRLVFDRWITFRGDSDEAWEHTCRFLVRDLVEAGPAR